MQDRFIRLTEVSARLGLSKSTIYMLLKCDPSFPRARQVGPRAVRWLASEIESWAASRQPTRA